MENHFGEKIIEEIKSKHIKPKPRWQFLAKDYLVWGLGGLALLVGGFASSVIIFMFTYNDWGAYGEISDSMLGFMLLTLPYFWIVILSLFIFVVHYNLKHTKKGYRYPAVSIIGGTIIISIILGVVFFGAGMGQAIDDILGENMPLYDGLINHRMHLWDKAPTGRMAGVVNRIIDEECFTLITPQREEWLIYAREANLPPRFIITVGEPLKILGVKISTSSFQASDILPPGPGKGFLRRPMHELPEMFEMMEEMHEQGIQEILRLEEIIQKDEDIKK